MLNDKSLRRDSHFVGVVVVTGSSRLIRVDFLIVVVLKHGTCASVA